jgi:transcriptional regulator with PAS, ATPase and Fis domain
LESELFGHERGAFTGAVERRAGRFELADGGTLFLDEVGELEPPMQVKLLRVLEERAFERVGGAKTLHMDVRLVAATNKDLKKLVSEGKFRDDLFYRLSVVVVGLPPLCERRDDIPLLVKSFLDEFSRENGKQIRELTPEALNMLLAYDWPGNVRELRNAIERAVILENSNELQPAALPDFHLEGRLRKGESLTITGNESLDELMSDFERQVINTTLEQSRYNISKTAEQLKISRHALRYRMQRLNISLGADEEGSQPPGAKEN